MKVNCEVHRTKLSVQIQPNAVELIRQCFTVQMENDPKPPAKAARESLRSQRNWIFFIDQVTKSLDLNLVVCAFQSLKTKLRETHK